MLILLIEKLLENEFKIIFFGFEQMFIPKKFRDALIFQYLPFNFYKFRKRPYAYFKLINQYVDLIKILKNQHKVKVLICVDPMGMVIAGRIKKLINVKIIYISFEIFFEEEFSIESKKIIKRLERQYSSKADIVIVQDKKRDVTKCK
jgi:hypothetical protein